MVRSVCVCVAAVIAGVASAGPDDLVVEGFEASADQATEMIEALRIEHGVPGMSASVWIDDAIVWSAGFGKANLEQDVDVSRETRFRLASISKVITADVAAKLAGEGTLDLDADVRTYVPDWPDKGEPITVRQLLAHMAGIRSYENKDWERNQPAGPIDQRYYTTMGEALDIFRDDPLIGEPGEQVKYSTFSFTLAAAAMEGATGESFNDLVRAHVSEPMRLETLINDDPMTIVPGRTRFYSRYGEEMKNSPYLNSAYKVAGGGMVATADDIATFGAAHFEPGFFSESEFAELFTKQQLDNGDKTSIGLGWWHGSDSAGRKTVEHNGSQAGTRTTLVVWPAQRMSVVIFSNLGDTPKDLRDVGVAVGELFIPPADPE